MVHRINNTTIRESKEHFDWELQSRRNDQYIVVMEYQYLLQYNVEKIQSMISGKNKISVSRAVIRNMRHQKPLDSR